MKVRRWSSVTTTIILLVMLVSLPLLSACGGGQEPPPPSILPTAPSETGQEEYEAVASKEFNLGIDWALNRILFSVSNNSGILKKDAEDNLYIEFHNSNLYLLKGGDLGHKPTKWNNYGRGTNKEVL